METEQEDLVTALWHIADLLDQSCILSRDDLSLLISRGQPADAEEIRQAAARRLLAAIKRQDISSLQVDLCCHNNPIFALSQQIILVRENKRLIGALQRVCIIMRQLASDECKQWQERFNLVDDSNMYYQLITSAINERILCQLPQSDRLRFGHNPNLLGAKGVYRAAILAQQRLFPR